MDLTRLYNLTTPELRQEAERLGVSDTYAMSRGQLIHAIRNRVSGGQQSEGFFGKVLGFAKWAIQAAQEEPHKETPSEPPRGEAPAEQSDAAEPRGEAQATASAAAPEAEAKRFGRPAEAPPMPSVGSGSAPGAPSAVPASVPASADVTEAVSGPESENGTANLVESKSESAAPSESASGPPSRPPVGVFSKTASIFEEPFPTLTMARILAAQGHFKRSLAIYATLQRDQPANRELSAEADEVRTQSRARRSEMH